MFTVYWFHGIRGKLKKTYAKHIAKQYAKHIAKLLKPLLLQYLVRQFPIEHILEILPFLVASEKML